VFGLVRFGWGQVGLGWVKFGVRIRFGWLFLGFGQGLGQVW
jgi:hypothetical protein